MSEEKMQNPYEEEHDTGVVALSRGAACAVIAVFILILLLPPLYRNVYEASVGGDEAWVPVVELFNKQPGQNLLAHLGQFETELEDGANFTEPPRQFVQGALTGSLREGNRKTYIGRERWLYLKPALDSLTGYGPISPEPDSVAKDPNLPPWEAPLPAIKNFAAQLDELGVELVLVPIPVKPMIYPEHITGKEHDAPLRHRDAAEFYRRIEELPNARVIDLTDVFWSAKGDAQLFLKQDTHWTPEGMALAARGVARMVGGTVSPDHNTRTSVEVHSLGDLVEQLELPGGGLQFFFREAATIEQVEGFAPDPTAKVVLLGDSFTNIYSQKSLNWGEDAGFAQHLASELGVPLDVIARNGQASTGVRRELASRGKEHLKNKDTVIWAIAARDLFLSETAARENNVVWEDVIIPDIADEFGAKAGSGSITLNGTLVKKSQIVDPKTVTYKNAFFVCEYQVDEVVAGTFEDDTILVAHWAFQDKKLSAASKREIGTKLRLELVPLDERPKIKSEQGFDDYDVDIEKMTATRYWAESESPVTAAGSVAIASAANPKRASLIATLACVLATVLVAALALRLRKMVS